MAETIEEAVMIAADGGLGAGTEGMGALE